MDIGNGLRNSAGSIGAVSTITDHGDEIKKLIAEGQSTTTIVSTNPEVEDPAAFAMEKHLEDFQELEPNGDFQILLSV
jgi:restriction system protein